MKKVVSLIDLKVMKMQNDCEIACDCVKRAYVVLASAPLHTQDTEIGWVPWCDSRNRKWQLSTAETRTDWRSDHPVVLDVPSAAIFSLRRARAAQ